MRTADDYDDNVIQTRYSPQIIGLIAVIGYALVVMIVYSLHG